MTSRTATAPLNHLRSFQIIGKHLSLARAAEELHLTASTLSHQLKLLENRLGTRLFVRNGRGLRFTDVGRKLHAQVDETAVHRPSHAPTRAAPRPGIARGVRLAHVVEFLGHVEFTQIGS